MTNQIKNNTHFLGEIIESSLALWMAQAWNWKQFPLFGSIIVVHSDSTTIFGLVHSINTGAPDGNRIPYAYQKTEAELMAEQPHIFAFLKTTVACVTIGFEKEGMILSQISPEPPRIHAFIAQASPQHIHHFLDNPDFLSLLFSVQLMHSIEEVLLAFVAYVIDLKIISREQLKNKLHAHFDKFYFLTGNDYRRLSLFVQRIEMLFA